MQTEGSVTRLIPSLKAGDDKALEEIFQRYFVRLVGLARKRLDPEFRRMTDEDDAAQSALKSFWHRLKDGGFPKLVNSATLWSLLAKITRRKVADHVHREMAKKRGGSKMQGESALSTREDRKPTASEVAELVDECEKALAALPSDVLRQVAILEADGYSRKEVASQLNCSERTVARYLAELRKIGKRGFPS